VKSSKDHYTLRPTRWGWGIWDLRNEIFLSEHYRTEGAASRDLEYIDMLDKLNKKDTDDVDT